MALPSHTLCSFRGVFGTPEAPFEEWQCSLRLTNDPIQEGFNEIQMQAMAEGAADAWNANMGSLMPNWVHLTQTRWVLVGVDGKTERRADGSYKQGVRDQSGQGTSTQNTRMPLSVALVASLETSRAGATGKGRIFLPYPAFPLSGDFTITPLQAENVANGVGNLISDLNSIGAGVVSVVSSKLYSTPVTSVRVGRVLDTMRSRRRAQPEQYVRDTVAISN